MDNDYDSAYGLTALFGLFFSAYIGFLIFIVLFSIAYYVVMSIALSKLFEKVGVEGWIAWVPYYRTWRWLEIGGQQGWLSLLSLVSGASIITSVFLYIGMWRTGIAFRKDAGFLVLGIFLPFVWAFLLARPEERYQPELITAAGYGPPLIGYGSVAQWQKDQWRQQQPPTA